MAFPALAMMGAGGGATAGTGATAAGGAAGSGIFGDIMKKIGARGLDKATGADFLSGMESITQGNAAAQLAAGQAAAAGGGVKTPGADIISSLTAQDTAANLSARSALDKFKEARDRKELGSNEKIAESVANA